MSAAATADASQDEADYAYSSEDLESEDDVVDEQPQAPPATPSRRVQRRTMAVAELLDTEEGYVRDLQTMVDGYLSAIPDETISWEEKLVIFGNVDELQELHIEFLAKLRAAVDSGDDAPQEIAALFTTDRFVGPYVQYCANHDRSIKALQLHLNDVEVAACLKACQEQLNHKLPLRDDLIKPVQRILKYPLLLREILGHTDNEEHQAYLRAALKNMQIVASRINKAKRERELRAIVRGEVTVTRSLSLQEKLSASGFEGSILDFGELIDEVSDVVLTIDTKRVMNHKMRSNELRKGSRRHVYLFSRVLLSCKDRTVNHTSVKDVYSLHTARIEKLDTHTIMVSDPGFMDERHVYSSNRLDADKWVESAMASSVHNEDASRVPTTQTGSPKSFTRRIMRRRTASLETSQRDLAVARPVRARRPPSLYADQDASDISAALSAQAELEQLQLRVQGLKAEALALEQQAEVARATAAEAQLVMDSGPALASESSTDPVDPSDDTASSHALEPGENGGSAPTPDARSATPEVPQHALEEIEAQRAHAQQLAEEAEEARRKQAELEARAQEIEAALEREREERDQVVREKDEARNFLEEQLAQQQEMFRQQQQQKEEMDAQLEEQRAISNSQLRAMEDRQAQDEVERAFEGRRSVIRALVWHPDRSNPEHWPAEFRSCSLEGYVMCTLNLPVPPADVWLDQYTCRGYMSKLGRFHKIWQVRWFVMSLLTGDITYYTGPDQRHAKGSVRLTDVCRAVPQDSSNSSVSHGLHSLLHVVVPTRTYHFQAPNRDALHVWVSAINSVHS
eukprot:m.70261 g.70261  ORF g.70261 m.70261 type:complete len:799 (-) comp7869_c1_seq1:81-2477(-)